MSKYEKIPIDFATIEPTREFFENGQRIVRIIDEKDLKEPIDLSIPKKRKGFVSLEEDNPAFLSEYDYELNFPLTPNDLARQSNRKIWWTISVIERDILFVISWKSTIANRQNGKNCPYLSGHRIHPYFNSLQARKPHIAAQWHPTKNGNLKPTDVTCGYDKKVWWQQKYYDKQLDKTFEFIWSSIVANRVKFDGEDNPYLSNKKIMPEFNSLQVRFKEIAEEWCWEKNGTLKPTEVFSGSTEKVYWKCKKCGYIYYARISNRTSINKTGCPNCAKSQFQRYIETIFEENNIIFENDKNLFKKYKYDIYVENINIFLELDGYQHLIDIPYYDNNCTFTDRVRWDNDKNTFALEQGIPLLRIPYLNYKQGKNDKKLERWVLDFIDTRQIPEDIITFYEKKNPLSNYSEIAKIMNTWVTEQKETVVS